MVDDVSKWTGIDECNVVYDAKTDKVRIYERGGWKEFISKCGLLRLVETLKENLLDYYEQSLVRRMHDATISAREKAECRERLEQLYEFLASFDMRPGVQNMTDDDIVNGDDGSYAIAEKCCALYRDVGTKTPTSTMNAWKNNVRKIVKSNSKAVVKDVNESILDLFNSDPRFRDVLVQAMPRLAPGLPS
jgi:hypothetical protein